MRSWLLSAILTPSILAFAGNELVEILPDDSISRTTWESRSLYHPYGKKIDGIPIRNIRKNWCAANILSLEQFPLEAKEDLAPIFQELDFAFNIDGLRVGKSGHSRASVGVAELCDKGMIEFFLLVTTHTRGRPPKVAFVQEFGDVDIIIIKKLDNQTIQTGFCTGCDQGADLTWRSGKFEWLKEEMGE